MNIPWMDARCIVCLEKRELTAEHIIPEVIGGRLRSDFLCKSCNNTLGTSIDSRLKTDPQIRAAALGLRDTLPGLVEAIENGAAYVGKSGYGEFQGSVKNGVFRARPLKPGDGSLMLSTPEARDAIAQMLRKQGRDAEIPAALEKFDGAPVNERIELVPGLETIERKGFGQRWRPASTSPTHGRSRPPTSSWRSVWAGDLRASLRRCSRSAAGRGVE